MGQFFNTIPHSLVPWILEQKIFWVATAPMMLDGHVNVSPKGFSGTFRYIDESTVWYEDLTGSGNETISHLRDNGRITIMFVAFEGPPRIVRLFGTGDVHEFGTPEYDRYLPPEERQPGSRAAIVINVHKVGSSCGFSIPFFQYRNERYLLHSTMQKRELAANEGIDLTDDGKPNIKSYWAQKNSTSMDGLPGLETAQQSDDTFVRGVINYPKDDVRITVKAQQRVAVSAARVVEERGVFSDIRVFAAFALGCLLTLLIQRVAQGIQEAGYAHPFSS